MHTLTSTISAQKLLWTRENCFQMRPSVLRIFPHPASFKHLKTKRKFTVCALAASLDELLERCCEHTSVQQRSYHDEAAIEKNSVISAVVIE